jgi:hypothetical protein
MKSFCVTHRFGKLIKAEHGQALALTAVGITMLLLMAGLGVDVGYLHYRKAQMQKAADAAAIAGAEARIYGGTYIAAARNDATANGFTHSTNGITVEVNSPPLTGGYGAGYVEVIIRQPQPIFFMRAGGFGNVDVKARAVASAIESGDGCIYALDPHSSGTFTAQGSIRLTSECGILDNSDAPSDAMVAGGGASVQVDNAAVGVVGGVSTSGGGTISPTPITGITHFSDPFTWIVPQHWDTATNTVVPCSDGTCETLACEINNEKINKDTILHGGVYCGGIDIEGGSTVTFLADRGPYILLGGGFKNVGGATLIGNGVTFYNTGTGNGITKFGSVNFGGNSGSTLSAPTSGPYAGILFFQDRTITGHLTDTNQFDGSNFDKLEGTIYSPNSILKYTGNNGINAYSYIVGWQIQIKGTADIGDNYSTLPGGTSLIKTAALVE